MAEMGNSTALEEVFTKGAHHLETSVILLNQNLYPKQKNARNCSLNARYYTIFRNIRGRDQVIRFGSQMNSKLLIHAYDDMATRDWGYLFIGE